MILMRGGEVGFSENTMRKFHYQFLKWKRAESNILFTQGSARRLVKAALHGAAKKREMRYSDLRKIERGIRRHFHDDITVIVVFLDSNLVSRASSVKGPTLSLRGGCVKPIAKV